MRIFFYSTRSYDRAHFVEANKKHGHTLDFFEGHLTPTTAALAQGYDAVCTFVNDSIDKAVIAALTAVGVRVIALRCAGFNQVDLAATAAAGITVVRVPAYSPYAVAEHTIGLLLTLNRKFHRAYARVRDNNFLLDGLEGFDIHGKTIGIVGTGRIGSVFANIMLGFGCNVLAYDPIQQNNELIQRGVKYTDLEKLLRTADIVSLHCPLTPQSHHLINHQTLALMKNGAMLINTSRGGLIDTGALIGALKSQHLGAVGLDVYEQEGDLFFADLSNQVVDDDIFQRLLTFPNVVVTGHQAFFTVEALNAIAETTLTNIDAIATGQNCDNEVTLDLIQAK
ncbi:MAG: 2-hydroxyacid dehydrogenase [Spongiibacteraceae bacterium]